MNGTLNVALIGGFEPDLDECFTILNFGSRSGVFPIENGLDIGNGKRFEVSYDANRVTLIVVPSAYVTVGSAQVPSGGTGSVPITVTDIVDPTGLGGIQFQIYFDPGMIRVDSLTGGDAPFGSVVQNIDTAAGAAVMLSTHDNMLGPTGDQLVANINFTAIGSPGSQTPLDITVTTLVNTVPDHNPAVASDGIITVE